MVDGQLRHYTRRDFERALLEFPRHQGLPANQQAAAQAIARHLAHRQTDVAEVYWTEGDHSYVIVTFTGAPARRGCRVGFGYVNHGGDEVPGSVPAARDGEFVTPLPINQLHGSHQSQASIKSATCSCGSMPGLIQPIGSECSYCGQIIVATPSA